MAHDPLNRHDPTSLLARVTVTVGGIVVFLVGLAGAEIYFPIEAKPSIWLRFSSGALPTVRLQTAYDEAEAKAGAATVEANSIKAHLPALQQANQQASQALRALDERIREKQAGEWIAPQLLFISQ